MSLTSDEYKSWLYTLDRSQLASIALDYGYNPREFNDDELIDKIVNMSVEEADVVLSVLERSEA